MGQNQENPPSGEGYGRFPALPPLKRNSGSVVLPDRLA